MADPLSEALREGLSDPETAPKVVANPEGYLQGRGVDTSNLRFGADAKEAAAEGVSVCGSIGYIACVSVGGS